MNWDLKLLRRVFVTAVIMAVMFCGIGCLGTELWGPGLAFAALGPGWWFNNRRKFISENALFLIFLGLAVYAGFRGVSGYWLLPGGIGALAAWDLDHFLRQVTAVSLIVGEALMVKTHLQQLLLVVVISLLVGLTALLIQINLSYGAAFILAFLAIWGLGFLLRQVVESSEN